MELLTMTHDQAIVEARRKLKERDLHGAVTLYERRITELSSLLAAQETNAPSKKFRVSFLWWSLTAILAVALIVMATFLALNFGRSDTDAVASTDDIRPQSDSGTQATLAWLESQEQIRVSATLQTYCSSVANRTKGDCRRWAETIMSVDYTWCKFCYDAYDWIRDRDDFSACLLMNGFAVLGDEAQVSPLKVSSYTEDEMRLMAGLSLYCRETYTYDYCFVWGALTYIKRPEVVTQCQGEIGVLSRFYDCLSDKGLDPDEV